MSENQSDDSLPLKGIRVLDVTQVWAGPYATRWLADLGAEVIKLESIQRPDSERLGARRRGGEADQNPAPYYTRSPRFNQVNSGKLGLTLDLSRPAGVDAFKRL